MEAAQREREQELTREEINKIRSQVIGWAPDLDDEDKERFGVKMQGEFKEGNKGE